MDGARCRVDGDSDEGVRDMRKLFKRLLPYRCKEFRWLQHGTPVPRGWTVAENTIGLSHHSEYAVLIFKSRWGWSWI